MVISGPEAKTKWFVRAVHFAWMSAKCNTICSSLHKLRVSRPNFANMTEECAFLFMANTLLSAKWSNDNVNIEVSTIPIHSFLDGVLLIMEIQCFSWNFTWKSWLLWIAYRLLSHCHSILWFATYISQISLTAFILDTLLGLCSRIDNVYITSLSQRRTIWLSWTQFSSSLLEAYHLCCDQQK